QTPGSGISILLAVGTPSTGSRNLYCQWELSLGSRNALCILFPTRGAWLGGQLAPLGHLTLLLLHIPPRRSTRLTPPTPIPTTDEADDLILQDTLQVKEHLIAKEIEKLVEGSENGEETVEVTSSSLRNDDNQTDPGNRKFNALAKNLEDVMMESSPKLVYERIKKILQTQVPLHVAQGPKNIALSLHKFHAVKSLIMILKKELPDWCRKLSTTSQSCCTNNHFPCIEKYKVFSIISKPIYGIIYMNNTKEKRLMRHQEVHKFCDSTLKRVLEELKSYNNDAKYGYVTHNRSKEDVEYLQLFAKEIEECLKYRDQMRRWEMYVNGRPVGSRRECPE
nr:hypothetical protein [Tanacetum cinerariifolium]